MLVFIDESGDPGFKPNSSDYFILAAVVFETQTSSIEATNIIHELLAGYKRGFEFHFTENQSDTRIKFLDAIKTMNFFWSAICIDKSKILYDSMKVNSRLTSEVSKYLCNNIASDLVDAKIIFDKKDSSAFYGELSKYLKREFNSSNQKIKKIVSKDSRQDVLLQVADYCAGVLNQKFKNPTYGETLMNLYLRKKNKGIQIWPK